MSTYGSSTLVAAVQAAPVFFDREATIEKVDALTKEAAAAGARLVAFPEGFVPTYPDWVWRTTPWADGEWYARWVDQCVDVPGPACDALAAIALENHVFLAVPVNERDGGTVYNTINFNFAAEGADAGPINLTAKETRITTYLCPSDPNLSGDNRNSYFASKGTTTVKSATTTPYAAGPPGTRRASASAWGSSSIRSDPSTVVSIR